MNFFKYQMIGAAFAYWLTVRCPPPALRPASLAAKTFIGISWRCRTDFARAIREKSYASGVEVGRCRGSVGNLRPDGPPARETEDRPDPDLVGSGGRARTAGPRRLFARDQGPRRQNGGARRRGGYCPPRTPTRW